MKRLALLASIFISVVLFALTASSSSNIFQQIEQHVTEMHPNDNQITVMFSTFYTQLILMTILLLLVIVVVVGLLLREYRKSQTAKKLNDVNEILVKKQYELEEQNTIIEELNAQLEDENERYQQQKETLQAITDSLGAGIIMLDPSGKIVFINKAWRELFNYLDFDHFCNSCEGFYVNDYTCGNTEIFLNNTMTGVENSQEVITTLLSLVGDGNTCYTVDLEQTSPRRRFLNLYSNPCVSFEDRVYGRVIVVRDVSHQKEVDRLKVELISTVSHELRTPMSSILGFSELLLTRKLSEERNKEYISLINSEAKRLTNLINDFLDIQKMESGKQTFNKQLNYMDQMIVDAIKLFDRAGDKHNIIYSKNTNNIPQVYCDRDKILQVLSNLISNAIKYSPDGKEIKISLTVDNKWIYVSVTDYGLGIPENAKDKLFTKFYRVDNDDRREIGGTGLGLAISKEIIRVHGGELGFKSIYGEGSTFYFKLPYPEDSSRSYLHENINNISSSQKDKLLIVENDINIVRLIKEILKDEKLEMHDVSSGEEALEYIAKYSYKLIILDIALDGRLNGWDVLKELKNNEITVETPIIISSIYENRDIAFQSDITDYLVKPFEPEQLLNMTRKALNGNANSKMMCNSDHGLNGIIIEMLDSKGIGVKQIEHSGNILIITLKGKEGL